MTAEPMWPWAALLLLGAVHGINPGMGWLFAVARGLQEQSSRAVWRTMIPLAVGHAIAVGVAVAAAAALGLVVPGWVLKWVVAAALLAAGVRQLVRHRHPRWGGMRMGSRDLAVWSFLVASAHGAGLMAVPFVRRMTDVASMAATDGGDHVHHAALAAAIAPASGDAQLAALVAVTLHTVGYLAVTGMIAVVVYERLGLRMLRTAWINLDLLWAVALVATALLTLFL